MKFYKNCIKKTENYPGKIFDPGFFVVTCMSKNMRE